MYSDYDTIWRTALGELEVILSKPSFITWFRDTFIIGVEDGVVIIGVPNSFAHEWLSKKYAPQIVEVLAKLLPEAQIKRIDVKITQLKDQPAIVRSDAMVPPAPATGQKKAAGSPPPAREDTVSPLNPNYTFDNFIVGTHNRLAHAASFAVASEPGRRHNPLFIYGGVGLGKTHLIHAIGNELLKQNPNLKILYASCERFANEFIHSIQTKKTEEFKERYRSLDLLLIDDIQFLAGKEGTQEEFFHTFNALHQTNRQIILTSDRMPQAIPELEDRLSSRFVWGMVTDIKNPDLETRSAILTQKSQERGQALEPAVVELIARHYQNNIRELEGGLNQILAFCDLEKVAPSLEVIKSFLNDNQPQRKKYLSVQQIFTVVSTHFQVAAEDLLGPRRNKEFVYPRQIAMYLLRHELNYSYPKIGRELGKDHTTVMHGVEKIQRDLPKNLSLQQELSSLKDVLYTQTQG